MSNLAATYAPLDTDFKEVMSTYFPGISENNEQWKILRMVFFAGAASSYEVLVSRPELEETVRIELLDQITESERLEV